MYDYKKDIEILRFTSGVLSISFILVKINWKLFD